MSFTIPEPLRSARAWLVWRLIQKPGQKKPSKIPFYASGAAREFGQGDGNDRAAMVTFDEALAACARGGYQGVGLATFSDLGVVAFDFDACVRDGVVDPRVLEVVQGTYAEVSPSGTGVRAFFRGSLPSRKDTKPDAGQVSLEVFGNSGFVTVTGDVLADHRMWGWDQEVAELSPAALKLYEQRFGSPMLGLDLFGSGVMMGAGGAGGDEGGSDIGALVALTPTLGWTLDEARAYLMDCDPGADRDHWLKALAAIHHEFNGSDAAFDLVNEWSARGENYGGRDDVMGRWRSFGKGRAAPITGRWLLKWREECNTRVRYTLAADWKVKIAECGDEFQLREKLCPLISKDTVLGELEREALAQVLFERFKTMGTKYPIAQCRKLIAEKRQQKNHHEAHLPDWLKGWVYVTDDDKFYRQDSDEWLSMQAFNAKYNRMIEGDEDGHLVKSAAWVALEDFQIKSVTRGVYLPWASSTFELQGVDCVNTFRPSSMPKLADEITPQGQGAIELFTRHLRMICDGREEIVQTLIAWMAHNVQRPGVKIRWTPLIKGVEGDGKTLLGSLMSAVLGHPNVKQISPKVLGTDFTDWAHGACVGVLEEIKLTGHNRHDIMNALKPFITNDQVPVHPKGQAERNVINTMNYIAFTNHADALPLGDTDRRFYIIFTPFTSKDELVNAIRLLGWGDAGAYFDALYGAIAAHVSELRLWLISHAIPASFKPNGSAPMTEEKARMVAMSASAEEEDVREAIEGSFLGVSSAVLSSSCLSDAMTLGGAQEVPKTSALNRLLVKLGWSKVPGKVKWRGKSHTVWTKGKVPTDNGYLRDALEKTAEKASDGFAGVSVTDDLAKFNGDGFQVAVDLFN